MPSGVLLHGGRSGLFMPVLWVLTAMRSSIIAPEGGAPTGVSGGGKSGLFMPVLWVLTAMRSSTIAPEGGVYAQWGAPTRL